MSDETKICPYCGEEINVKAKRCRRCLKEIPVTYLPTENNLVVNNIDSFVDNFCQKPGDEDYIYNKHRYDVVLDSSTLKKSKIACILLWVVIGLFSVFAPYLLVFPLAYTIYILNIYIEERYSKLYSSKIHAYISNLGINIDNIIKIQHERQEFLVDCTNKTFIILSYGNYFASSPIASTSYSFESLAGYSLHTSENTEITGNGMAYTNDALGGIITGYSNNQAVNKTDRQLVLNIKLNDVKIPLINLITLNRELNANDYLYDIALKKTNEIIALLEYILNINNSSKIEHDRLQNIQYSTSIEDKLVQLEKLKEKGLISQEEYTMKKADILNCL